MTTLLNTKTASRPPIYYGWTPNGSKLHLGDSVDYHESKHVVKLGGFCGVTMRSWENGSMPAPSRVGEFCRNCFRTIAWEAFSERVENMAKVGVEQWIVS